MTIRVLHVTTVPMSLRFLRGQGRFMATRGVQLLAASSPGPGLESWGRDEGIETYPVPIAREIDLSRDVVSLARLTRLVRRLEPDIVHVHTPKASLLGLMAASAAGVRRRVYHMRGLRFMGATGPRRRVLFAAEWLTTQMSTDIVAVGPSLAAVARAHGLDACPIRVLARGSGQGVDSEHFSRAAVDAVTLDEFRRRYELEAATPVFTFVGRLTRDKGIVELAAAWRVVREQCPASRLLVVGPIEEGDAVPPETLRALRADPRVALCGSLDDPAPAYAASDVLVLPTYREGFPNVPLEAGAMELPTIATRVTGCVDAVVDGVTGLLVEPKDPLALAEAMLRYAGDPDMRRSHGEASRTRVVEWFRPEPIWAELADLYLNEP